MTQTNERCSTRWCDEHGEHPQHRNYVGEVMPVTFPYSTLQVTVESGLGEPDNPTLIMTTTMRDGTTAIVRMSWPQVDVLVAMLTAAAKRYGGAS